MGSFSADVSRMYSAHFDAGGPSLRQRLSLWLLNSELHGVACYRFGRATAKLRARNRVLGALPTAVHLIWRRWTTHVDHLELSPRADIGPGLLLMHRHGVIVGPAIIGANCVLHQNVTIGQRVARGDKSVPRIGNDVWIGPGAILTGGITIGDRVTIAAGTVLSRDVPDGCLVGGNPGRLLARDYNNSLPTAAGPGE